MKRLFALLLIVLLPVQTGWAAVAGACADAGRAEAMHLGHHMHGDPTGTAAHASPATADASPTTAGDPASTTAAASDDARGGTHPDCPTCHGVGVAMPIERALPSQAVARGPGIRFVAPSPPQVPPGDLFRPPTSHVA
ncbi:MAG: hypothetical protein WCK28_15115 [Burkholderiales bacterium]|jgi:hypothetical protein